MSSSSRTGRKIRRSQASLQNSAYSSGEVSHAADVAVEPFTPARPDRITFGRMHAPRPRPPKLYRIGEVVEYSGMSRQTVHNYTTMGLLPETRWTSGGHRLYDESDFERLDLIAELKTQNKSMQDIRKFFATYDASRQNGSPQGENKSD